MLLVIRIFNTQRTIMNFQSLNIFIDLARSKNFGITGKKFNLSATTVARRITQLEEEIGHTLLVNTTRVFELTANGVLIFNRFNKLIAELNSEVCKANELLNEDKTPFGKLKIQLPLMLPLNSITPALPKFCSIYPDIELEVIYSNHKPNMDEDNIDFAIVNYPFDEYTNIIKHIATRQIQLCCSTKYEKNHGIPMTPEQMSQHSFVQYVDNNYLDQINQQILKLIHIKTKQEYFVRIPPLMTTNNEFHNLKMVTDGEVICNILDVSLAQLNDFVLVLGDYSVGEVKYYAIKSKNPRKQKLIRTIASFIIDQLNEYSVNAE